MDTAADTHRRRQELKEEAYYLVLKALVLRDKPDMTLLARLRLELSIGTDSHKQWMTELLRAKQAGTLGIPVDDRPGYRPSVSAMPMMGSNRASTRQLSQQPSITREPAAIAKTKVLEPENNLPHDPIHLKVQYYNRDGWHEGVITEFNAETRKIRVNMLTTKRVEWLDYIPTPCLVVHANARVTDLSPYV